VTDHLDRRSFLGLAAGLAAFPNAAIAAPRRLADDDWAIFSKLASLFASVMEATDPIADGITRLKFVRFLNSIHGPLADIIREKQVVLDTLLSAQCTGDATTIRSLAGGAAEKIVPLVKVLEGHVRVLSTAIKPAGTREAAAKLADSMHGLQSRKMWVHRISSYCHGSPQARSAFLAEVRRSASMAADARSKLDGLLDHLTQ
jgi:hypothetical protein